MADTFNIKVKAYECNGYTTEELVELQEAAASLVRLASDPVKVADAKKAIDDVYEHRIIPGAFDKVAAVDAKAAIDAIKPAGLESLSHAINGVGADVPSLEAINGLIETAKQVIATSNNPPFVAQQAMDMLIQNLPHVDLYDLGKGLVECGVKEDIRRMFGSVAVRGISPSEMSQMLETAERHIRAAGLPWNMAVTYQAAFKDLGATDLALTALFATSQATEKRTADRAAKYLKNSFPQLLAKHPELGQVDPASFCVRTTTDPNQPDHEKMAYVEVKLKNGDIQTMNDVEALRGALVDSGQAQLRYVNVGAPVPGSFD